MSLLYLAFGQNFSLLHDIANLLGFGKGLRHLVRLAFCDAVGFEIGQHFILEREVIASSVLEVLQFLCMRVNQSVSILQVSQSAVGKGIIVLPLEETYA